MFLNSLGTWENSCTYKEIYMNNQSCCEFQSGQTVTELWGICI